MFLNLCTYKRCNLEYNSMRIAIITIVLHVVAFTATAVAQEPIAPTIEAEAVQLAIHPTGVPEESAILELVRCGARGWKVAAVYSHDRIWFPPPVRRSIRLDEWTERSAEVVWSRATPDPWALYIVTHTDFIMWHWSCASSWEDLQSDPTMYCRLVPRRYFEGSPLDIWLTDRRTDGALYLTMTLRRWREYGDELWRGPRDWPRPQKIVHPYLP